MIPIQKLAQARTSAGPQVELTRRGDIAFLCVDRVLARSTETVRVGEIAAIAVCEPILGKRQPRVLIEGLGLGGALRKAHQVLPPRGWITVAEAVPEIVAWHREFLEPLPVPTEPDHLRVVSQSFRDCLKAQPDSYDGIILELDYAIDPFLQSGARPGQYAEALALLKSSLRPSGRVAIRCEREERALHKALGMAGFTVDHRVDVPHKRSKARCHVTIAKLR